MIFCEVMHMAKECYIVRSEEAANVLIQELKAKGYIWADGTSLSDHNNFITPITGYLESITRKMQLVCGHFKTTDEAHNVTLDYTGDPDTVFIEYDETISHIAIDNDNLLNFL